MIHSQKEALEIIEELEQFEYAFSNWEARFIDTLSMSDRDFTPSECKTLDEIYDKYMR